MVKQDNDQVTALDMAILLAISGAIAALLSGCGPTVGWQAGIYVNPVNQIESKQELKGVVYGNNRGFETSAR